MAKRLIRLALWLALGLALLGSLTHVAWAFSTLEPGSGSWPRTVATLEAIAVDVGLAALAFGIQQRRRQNRSARVLWIGIGLFSAVSTYANLLHGFAFSGPVTLGDAPAWLGSLRPWLLSGVLPLLVLYLSEVVSEDVRHEAEHPGEQKSAPKPTPASEQKGKQRGRGPSREAAKRRMASYMTIDPNVGVRELARLVNKPVSTVSELRREILAEKIGGNGHGERHD